MPPGAAERHPILTGPRRFGRSVRLRVTLHGDPRRKAFLPEDVLWRDFNDAASVMVALPAGSRWPACFADLPTLQLPRLPGMADYAWLACTAAPAFGWTAAAMLHGIEANRAGSVEAVIEADAVAAALRALLPKA